MYDWKDSGLSGQELTQLKSKRKIRHSERKIKAVLFSLSFLKLHSYAEVLRPIIRTQPPTHSLMHATCHAVFQRLLNEVCQDRESMPSFQGEFPEKQIQIALKYSYTKKEASRACETSLLYAVSVKLLKWLHQLQKQPLPPQSLTCRFLP